MCECNICYSTGLVSDAPIAHFLMKIQERLVLRMRGRFILEPRRPHPSIRDMKPLFSVKPAERRKYAGERYNDGAVTTYLGVQDRVQRVRDRGQPA